MKIHLHININELAAGFCLGVLLAPKIEKWAKAIVKDEVKTKIFGKKE